MTPLALRDRLSALGLSQAEAARRMGIDPRTVRRYCAGDLPITRLVELALDGLAAGVLTENAKGRSAG